MEEILRSEVNKTTFSLEMLIEGLKSTRDEVELRQLQFRFYRLFSGYLYKAALQKFRNFRDPNFLAEEVLQKTFITALDKIKAGKFKFPARAEAADHDKIIKAWLGRIATNESKKR